ncbi:uncharacterized protein [Rhodnius prolixus]|uniref:uncharacterized protein n=1 Tax=Rhodnius prolixus TaxID=13249 RepID=UPI003D18F9D6
MPFRRLFANVAAYVAFKPKVPEKCAIVISNRNTPIWRNILIQVWIGKPYGYAIISYSLIQLYYRLRLDTRLFQCECFSLEELSMPSDGNGCRVRAYDSATRFKRENFFVKIT